MPRSKVAPPGARFPLLVLAFALAAGAAIFLGVHLAVGAAPRSPSSIVASPGAVSPGAPERATP